MKETETLSYSLLCQLYDEVKELEENAIDDFFIAWSNRIRTNKRNFKQNFNN